MLGRKERPKPDAMTLVEHLAELRKRLVIIAVAFVVASVFSAVFYSNMITFLQHPYCSVEPHHCEFYVTGPLDPLSLRVKLASFGGLLISLPVLLFQVWRFITPGLKKREKRYAIPFVLSSVVLFLLGCSVAYLIFPKALHFLIAVGGNHIQELLSPNSYLSLITLLMLLFGICFEFPVILVALELVNVVNPNQLLKAWRWAVIGITVVAGVFTPSSDPFSMMALAVPLIAFYFMAIGIGKLFGK